MCNRNAVDGESQLRGSQTAAVPDNLHETATVPEGYHPFNPVFVNVLESKNEEVAR